MKRYDSYKDSGVEWIGEIPSHWDIIKLKFIGESIIGITYSPDDVVNEGKGILVLRSSNIQEGRLSFEDNVFVNKKIEKKYLTQKGDILVCARNGSAHLVGKSAFINNEYENLTFGAFMSIVRSDLGKFLFYFFNSQIFKAQTGLFTTSTINQLTSDTLNNLFISTPCKEIEQTAIANFLDRKTVEIDQLIADKKCLIELYEEEKTAIINQAVTKGIDENVKLKDSGIEWLGEIPEHWEVKRLKYVANIQTGRTPHIQNSELDYFDNGNINWFTPSDISKNEELIESNRKINSFAVTNNEVELFNEFSVFLVSIGATIGKVGYSTTKASANQQINIITFHESIFYQLYGYYFFVAHKEMVKLEADYTTLPILNQTKTKNLLIICPSLEEQQSIVRKIETDCTCFDAKIVKTKKLIELLTEYRATLISEVVTGKIKII